MIIRRDENGIIVEDGYNILGYYLENGHVVVHNYNTGEEYEPAFVPPEVAQRLEVK